VQVVYEVTTRGLIRGPSSPFAPNSAFSDERLVKEGGLPFGHQITPGELAATRDKLTEFYRSQGYSRVKVEVAWDGSDFSFLIEEGPRSRG
jgi:outer membrane protein assembly factor BamA